MESESELSPAPNWSTEEVEKMPELVSTKERAALQSTVIPVYRRYPNQTNTQPAYIVVDPERVERGMSPVYTDYSSEIGNARTAHYYHRREAHISIEPHSRGESILEFIDTHAAELAQIIAGYSCEWDGNNHVGLWTQEALDLLEKLEDDARDEIRTVMVYDSPEELDINITANDDPDNLAQEVWDSISPDDWYPAFDRDNLVEYIEKRVAELKAEEA